MAMASLEEIQQDELAMSIARALRLANECALAHGIQPSQAMVTVTEESSTTGRMWRIHYGQRDYVNRRGGDLIIVVDEDSERVVRVLRGQ